jgi:hypothetical protein
MIGAIFMKFGRAPTTHSSFLGTCGMFFHVRQDLPGDSRRDAKLYSRVGMATSAIPTNPGDQPWMEIRRPLSHEMTLFPLG